MSRKKKNKKKISIDLPEARTFLWEAYGLKSKVVNFYHLKVVHEEYLGVFNWYYTTGTLVVEYENHQHRY